MSALSGHVEDYLRLRRALGFKLEREGRLLGQFVAYLETVGAASVTSELAIAWAQEPVGAQLCYWAKRLGVVRKFAAYLHTIDPATEVPPPGVFAARRCRPTPYLWSHSDICRLLDGARTLPSLLRAANIFRATVLSGQPQSSGVAVVGDTVEISVGNELIRSHPVKHDRTREHGAWPTPAAGPTGSTPPNPRPGCQVGTGAKLSAGYRDLTVTKPSSSHFEHHSPIVTIGRALSLPQSRPLRHAIPADTTQQMLVCGHRHMTLWPRGEGGTSCRLPTLALSHSD